ncbi:YkgJ family cysteine cluster protein [Marinobacterium arenosum]|uniref:YkgJ family cysteine cluster protein n=1 Tax=Marinobacterium arenosum TaxID=2862496 RepID=UPI001C94CD6F|nr:YkgJ family cysteine cluster protein [Marinobacterium arenosum]MBY4676967.1 YkgJ family cysteine cluster protein [Marinobacterium arenosum]
MQCRTGCGACCIAPSISSLNKPAGERCRHLSPDNLCALFGQPERPQACADFQAEIAICGDSRDQALQILALLEQDTLPA